MFWLLHAHHQELTTALAASGFTLEHGGSSTTNNPATTMFQGKTGGC
jgi:hypothetical protein